MSQSTDLNQPVSPNAAPRDPLPIRMLNEFAYCPRLFHLMHVEGRWADNVCTIEGRHIHRRVDKLDHVLPGAVNAGDAVADGSRQDQSDEPAGDDPPTIARSVPLGSTRLGLTAKLDLVSVDDKPQQGELPEAVPVETKRGRVPDTPQRSYEPERVQLMAQGLLLREHGYHCDHGVPLFGSTPGCSHDISEKTSPSIRASRQGNQR